MATTCNGDLGNLKVEVFIFCTGEGMDDCVAQNLSHVIFGSSSGFFCTVGLCCTEHEQSCWGTCPPCHYDSKFSTMYMLCNQLDYSNSHKCIIILGHIHSTNTHTDTFYGP